MKHVSAILIWKHIDSRYHCLLYTSTTLADLSLAGTQKDAYYIDREGSYPFAIVIPILIFISVTEKKSIDTEYPNFKADVYKRQVLAVCTFLAVNIFGTKHYWKDIFWPDAVSYTHLDVYKRQVRDVFWKW